MTDKTLTDCKVIFEYERITPNHTLVSFGTTDFRLRSLATQVVDVFMVLQQEWCDSVFPDSSMLHGIGSKVCNQVPPEVGRTAVVGLDLGDFLELVIDRVDRSVIACATESSPVNPYFYCACFSVHWWSLQVTMKKTVIVFDYGSLVIQWIGSVLLVQSAKIVSDPW